MSKFGRHWGDRIGDAVSPFGLGLIKRGVRGGEQGVHGALARSRRHSDADGQGYRPRVRYDLGPGDPGPQTLIKAFAFQPDGSRSDHEELPSAVPADAVVFPQSALNTAGESDQSFVAGLVPVSVVDVLEMVDVEHPDA